MISSLSGMPYAHATDKQTPYTSTAAEISALLEKTQQNTELQIIIGLNVEYNLEGELLEMPFSRITIDSQRDMISNTQDALLLELDANLLESINSEIKYHNYKYIPYMSMTVDEYILSQLNNSSLVLSIVEDIPIPYTLSESIPLIGINGIWDSLYTGEGQTIAILDTGVDKNHPFLSDKVVSEACYSTTSATYSSTILCPSGLDEDTSTGSAEPCVGLCDHGTHVAGIAAGNDAGNGFSGVAKDANLIAIQIFSEFDNPTYCGSSNPCVLTYTSDQIKGLERVYDLRDDYDISSVNMSIGGGQAFSPCDTDSRKAIIDQLRSVGIATIIASGNNGFTDSTSLPACISSAISVGSVNDGSSGTTTDEVSSFSNSANFLDLLAPGAWITSSVPGALYETWQGTSMAAPHVAGAWAVLASQNTQSTVDEILNSLVVNGVIITDTRNGLDTPRINFPSEDKLDLVFLIDATGSMFDDIEEVQDSATDLIDTIQSQTTVDTRFALATYKDFPESPYGELDDYTYNAEQGFTQDGTLIQTAINAIVVSGGADWPESVYSALMNTISGTDLGTWRSDAVKAIILMGDAPPHDPEPNTGYTMASVIAAANAGGISVPLVSEVNSLAVSSNISFNIHTIAIGNDEEALSTFTQLANGTDGYTFTAESALELIPAIDETLGGIFGGIGVGNAPVITSLVADDLDNLDHVYSIYDTITIHFDSDTNTPGGENVQIKPAVDDMFTFTESLGRAYSGKWIAPDTFIITIHSINNAGPPTINNTFVTLAGTTPILSSDGTSGPSIFASSVLSGNFGIIP